MIDRILVRVTEPKRKVENIQINKNNKTERQNQEKIVSVRFGDKHVNQTLPQ